MGLCIVLDDEIIWTLPKDAFDLCNDEALELGTGRPLLYESSNEDEILSTRMELYGDYHIPLFQVYGGHNPQVRVLGMQTPYRDNLWRFRWDLVESFLLPVLSVFLLILGAIYWLLYPLKRMYTEVLGLYNNPYSIINAGRYPRELKEYAKVLQEFISKTQAASKTNERLAEEAQIAKREIEWATLEMQAAKVEFQFRSQEVIQRTVELVHRMRHHKKNLAFRVSSQRPELEGDAKDLFERLLRVLQTTDELAQNLCDAVHGNVRDIPDIFNIGDELGILMSLVQQDYSLGKRKRSIELFIPKEECAVVITRAMFGEVCFEILNNAAKYSRSKVLVRVKRANARIMLEFHNDGERFPAQEREKMFNWGTRGSSESPGTGIGLYLVKQQLEVCDGKIKLEDSAELEGAVVCLDLPAGPVS